MSLIDINSITQRYLAAFGYVPGNMLGIAAERAWGKVVDIPIYKETFNESSNPSTPTLFAVDNSYFADATFTSVQTGEVWHFGLQKNEFTIALPLMVAFSREKTNVITPIDKSEVEVIEYFGLKPYIVSINGILVDMENHNYPEASEAKIHKLFATKGTFKVTGKLFSNKGITELYIDSGFKVDYVEGYVDTVKFSFNARQTRPTEMKAVGY